MNDEPHADELPLEELLKSAAGIMTSQLRQQLISHPGELGTAREQIIREFLASHLPNQFGVSTGFAFDCNGHLSRQLDIVIYDASVCPRFEIAGGKRIFPCEAIVAVGQVKSSVKSRKQFRDAIENLASVKKLDRSANGMAFDFRHNERLTPSTNHLHQIFTFLFITGDAMSGQLMAETLLEDAFKIPVEHLPNLIVALDKYLVTYCCDGGVCPNVMDARGVALQTAGEPADDVFLRFYLLLGQALNAIRTASLPYWEYLSKYRSIPARVFSSSVEDPPPHLGKWSEGAPR